MVVVAAGWEEGYSSKVGVWIYRDAAFQTILPQVVLAVVAKAQEETAAAGSAVVFSPTEALSRCENASRQATRRMEEPVATLMSQVTAVKAAEAEFFFSTPQGR